MRIRHRLVFNKRRISIDFMNFLELRNAVFSDDGSDLIVVYIYEEDEFNNRMNLKDEQASMENKDNSISQNRISIFS